MGPGRTLFQLQRFLSQHTEVGRSILLPCLYLIFCRKWNRLCVSFDFQKDQAQVAVSGKVSEVIVDPETRPNMNGREEEFVIFCFQFKVFSILGRFDNNIVTAANTSELILILGRYPFDKNPYIGTLADINVWSR